MLHFAGFFTDKRFCSSLLVDSSLQRFTLAQMTTQHNPTLLHVVQIRFKFVSLQEICCCVTRKTWSLHWMFLHHSPMLLNLHTSSFLSNLHSTLLCTRSCSFYNSTKPASMANPFGDAVFNTMLELLPVDLVFLAAILVRYACTQDGTPACFPRLHSFVARFLAIARLRNQLSWVLFVHSTTRVPVPSPFVCLTDWECSCAWGSKLRTIFLLEAFDGWGRSLQSSGAYDSRAA